MTADATPTASSPAGAVPGPADSAARPFDALGKAYEDTYAHLPEQLAAIDWLLARLPQRARVMDIGSGTGRPTADRIAAQGHEVTGYDVSRTMIDLARAQVPAARFELADVRALPDTPGQWDAVTAFFPLLQMPRADLDATLARIADWLAPGGAFVFATVPFDAEDQEMRWMGQTVRCTSYPAETYGQLLRRAGLEVVHEELSVFRPDFPGMGTEEHLFLYAVKPGGPAVPAHTLAGPYPLPEEYRGPHELSEQGWLGMEARFERHDIALVADALSGNAKVLDVGGGTGAVVREIAARLGSVTTVEPHTAREESMRPLARGAYGSCPAVPRNFRSRTPSSTRHWRPGCCTTPTTPTRPSPNWPAPSTAPTRRPGSSWCRAHRTTNSSPCGTAPAPPCSARPPITRAIC